jgi:hypothetical protein
VRDGLHELAPETADCCGTTAEDGFSAIFPVVRCHRQESQRERERSLRALRVRSGSRLAERSIGVHCPLNPPTYLRAYLPTCLPAYLSAFLPSFLPSVLPSFLPSFLPSIHSFLLHSWCLATIEKYLFNDTHY